MRTGSFRWRKKFVLRGPEPLHHCLVDRLERHCRNHVDIVLVIKVALECHCWRILLSGGIPHDKLELVNVRGCKFWKDKHILIIQTTPSTTQQKKTQKHRLPHILDHDHILVPDQDLEHEQSEHSINLDHEHEHEVQ